MERKYYQVALIVWTDETESIQQELHDRIEQVVESEGWRVERLTVLDY